MDYICMARSAPEPCPTKTPEAVPFSAPDRAGSTLTEALDLMESVGKNLDSYLSNRWTAMDRAYQAVQMQQNVLLATRNSLKDGNALASLNLFHPVRTFDELKADLGKKYSRDVLAEKIVEAAKKNLNRDAIGCFAGGTLVHTKEGLKPIQDIKVGDFVLSKPESGDGETAYKRVVNTFEFQNKEVWYVEYIAIDKASKYAECPGVEVLIVTPNHPFWVLGVQNSKQPALCDYYEHPIWKTVAQLEDREVVLLNNGDMAKISGTAPIKKTSTPGLGWHQAQYGGEHDKPLDLDGHYVYFEDKNVRADITFRAQAHYNDDALNELGDYESYLATVYNLEVEDYHTYYVGEMGVWVHNTNCGAREGGDTKLLGTDVQDAVKNKLWPTRVPGVYPSPDAFAKSLPASKKAIGAFKEVDVVKWWSQLQDKF